MVMAADLSLRLGRCCQDEAKRIKALVAASGLPTAPPESVSPDKFLALMSKDKKRTDQGTRFVLMSGGIGRTEVVNHVDQGVLEQTLSAGDQLCE